MKYKHDKKFWTSKRRDYNRWAKKNGLQGIYDNTQMEALWDRVKATGAKDVMKAIKYYSKYQTNYNTALAHYKKLKEEGLQGDLKFKDIKKLGTRELAERVQTRISQNYRELKESGLSGKEAAEYISIYWFGSE